MMSGSIKKCVISRNCRSEIAARSSPPLDMYFCVLCGPGDGTERFSPSIESLPLTTLYTMWGTVHVFSLWILVYSPVLSFSFAGPLASLRNTKVGALLHMCMRSTAVEIQSTHVVTCSRGCSYLHMFLWLDSTELRISPRSVGYKVQRRRDRIDVDRVWCFLWLYCC